MDKPFTFPKALLRWVILVVIAWLFMFLVPGQWFVNWYLPMSFFLLMGTVTFGVIGSGLASGGTGRIVEARAQPLADRHRHDPHLDRGGVDLHRARDLDLAQDAADRRSHGGRRARSLRRLVRDRRVHVDALVRVRRHRMPALRTGEVVGQLAPGHASPS